VADAAITKGKLAASGGSNGQVLGTDGTGLVWRDPAAGSGTGDISAVTAGTGLAGGGTTGDVTLSVATGGIVSAMLAANAVTSDKVTDGAIATADLASGAVTKTKLAASGGTNNQVLGTDGTNLLWKDPPAGSGTGDITAVIADSGLTGGGTTGDVTLAIATGGITTSMLAVGTVTSEKIFDGSVDTLDLASGSVTAAKIADGAVGTADLHDGAVTKAKLAAGGGANNQVLSTDGTNLLWKDPPSGSGTGDITAVNAGAGLAGGGTTGDVTLGIASNGVTTAMLANAAVTLSKLDGSGAVAGKVLKNNGGAVVWGDDETGALTVPLVVETGSSSSLFTITNTGSGSAVTATAGTTWAIKGTASGGVGAVVGQNNGSGNPSPGVAGGSATGPGVYGLSTNGFGVYGTSTSGSGVYGFCGTCAGVEGVATSGSSAFGVKGAFGFDSARWGFLGGSGAGVGGVSSVGFAVHGEGSGNGLSNAAVRAEATGSGGIALYATNSSDDATIVGTNNGSGHIVKLYGGPTSDLRFTVQNNGNVRADGTFASPAADFAEMLPGRDGLEPGDVLAIGADGRLMRSVEAYQASVLGVYSTRPAFLGGSGIDEDAGGLVPLAVVGVVPVKASAENGAIRPGDMLVSSTIPGHAMRAGAAVPNGRGIGKALGNLESGTGVIS
ncbi:MAG: beta strand repeat-containing protein, partial [Acidobacteriota bacterium]